MPRRSVESVLEIAAVVLIALAALTASAKWIITGQNPLGQEAAPAPQRLENIEKPAPKVRLGIDNIDDYADVFKGKRVGLITNQTGIASDFRTTVDILREKTNLVALYAPEHGVWGDKPAGAGIGTYIDQRTGLTVYSLYGKTKKPTPEMLANIDVLAYDIQDVGARPYTYMYTMAYAMQSCKEQGKTFVVFDRPNPLGGREVEGNLVEPGYESFIGMYPIPQRYGLTIGEIARLFNDYFGIGCNLVVVPMRGWKRDMYFSDTGLPWVMPSPNIPTPETALLYNATGIFGGTNVSEGVGTTRPFEYVGAPWIDPFAFAARMNALNLPGVYFRPAYFTPAFFRYQGQVCGGVQIHVTDRRAFRPVRTGLSLLYTVRRLSGDKFQFTPGRPRPNIDLVTGCSYIREGSLSLEEVISRWDREAAKFKEMSQKYYLYQD